MSDNQQYEQLEQEIDKLKQLWSEQIQAENLLAKGVPGTIQEGPLVPQLSLTIPVAQYQVFIEELLELLCEHQPGLQDEANRLVELLTEEIVQEWFQAAITLNDFYFANFAETHQLAVWLPHFVAEQAARPYLKAIASATAPTLEKMPHHGCPACGEPPRLAVISKKGKKELACPRCEYAWEEKKISCAHCGTEDHHDLEILKLEGHESSEIHVCHSCKGYTKLIDVRKMFKKESPQVLDAKSIHLDYIAQEKGYGMPIKQVTH